MSLTPDQIEHQLVNIQDNVQPNIYAACGICLVSAYLAVALRLVSRRLKHAPLGSDDYTIFIALVGYLPRCVGRKMLKLEPALHHRFCRVVRLQYVK